MNLPTERENPYELVALIIHSESKSNPIALKTSKSFLPILNKSLIEFQIRHLLNFGFNRIIIAIEKSEFANYEPICMQFLAEAKFNFLAYDELSNTDVITQLKKAAHFIKSDFLVMRGDYLTDIDLFKLHNYHLSNNSLLTSSFCDIRGDIGKVSAEEEIVGVDTFECNRIVLYQKFDNNKTGLALTKNGVGSAKLFPQILNTGLSFVSKEFLDVIVNASSQNGGSILSFCFDEKNKEWMKSNKLAKRIFLYKVPVDNFCENIADLEDFRTTNFQILKALSTSSLLWSEWLIEQNYLDFYKNKNKLCRFGQSCYFGESVSLGPNGVFKKCVVGEHCHIGANTKIINSIVFDHVTIQDGVAVRNSVIKSNSHLMGGCELDGITLEENSVVEELKKIRSR